MSELLELSDEQSERIEDLSIRANELIESDDFDGAFKVIIEALEVVPAPRESYFESTWLYSTLGDIYYLTSDYTQALAAFTDAVQCPEGLGNPFIHLRLGECQFELGNFDKAADELMRAYMADGMEIFELEDPKYFEFLKTRAQIQ